MASYHAPRDWEQRIDWLAAALHGRSRWRLPVLVFGALFAQGRRVVASWIRAAGVSDDYQDFYAFLQSVGRQWSRLGDRLLVLVLLRVLKDQQRVLLAIDDSPTKRYGPQVQGAGIHHDPTPRPSGNAFCYGHVWVTLAVIVRHRVWGTIPSRSCRGCTCGSRTCRSSRNATTGRSRPSSNKPPTWYSGPLESCAITANRSGAWQTVPTPSGPSCSRC